jgi:hypothetical protein
MPEAALVNITPAILDSYLGKQISQICGNSYTDAAINHCAHFVNHVMALSFPTSCRNLVHGPVPGANIRVQETFAHCGEVGRWPPPLPLVKCYAFVTKASEVDLPTKTMGNIENKHVGIFCETHVWHYSNTQDKVVKVTPDQFSRHYTGPGYAMFYGEFPSG